MLSLCDAHTSFYISLSWTFRSMPKSLASFVALHLYPAESTALEPGGLDPFLPNPTSLPPLPPLSPVSSSRKARQRLASRGSRTQLPVPAAHSSRRLCPASPSSTPLRSCRGTARVGCSQLAGGPLRRGRAKAVAKSEWHETQGGPALTLAAPLTHLMSPVTFNT